MTTIHVLLVGNDSVLDIDRVRDEVSGSYLNAAAVSVTLVDAAGAEVAGQTWPLVVPHVAASDGLYRVTLPYTLALVADARYMAQVVVDGGDGLLAAWGLACVARTRG
jgi:hypothetical protein